MNKRLDQLYPYPFEKLNVLLDDIVPPDGIELVSLSLGEPKHRAPEFIINRFSDRETIARGFGMYPPTRGFPTLRQAIADFVNKRFNLTRRVNPDTEVLPVNGTREGLVRYCPDCYRWHKQQRYPDTQSLLSDLRRRCDPCGKYASVYPLHTEYRFQPGFQLCDRRRVAELFPGLYLYPRESRRVRHEHPGIAVPHPEIG